MLNLLHCISTYWLIPASLDCHSIVYLLYSAEYYLSHDFKKYHFHLVVLVELVYHSFAIVQISLFFTLFPSPLWLLLNHETDNTNSEEHFFLRLSRVTSNTLFVPFVFPFRVCPIKPLQLLYICLYFNSKLVPPTHKKIKERREKNKSTLLFRR